MDNDERKRNFARNLEVLCKSYSSVAEICRRSGVNRQQFNKYLSGKHLPAGKVRAQIAAFFEVEEEDLFKSAARFDELIEGPRLDISWKMRSSGAFQRIVPFIKGSADRIRGYSGVYFRYHNSSIHRGRVLRSVLYLYQHNGIAQYTIVERFPALDESGTTECVFKYHGFALFAGDRLFLIDFETLQQNELTFSIFLPNSRNALVRLFGLVSGIAATPLRKPFSTRVALDFQGKGRVAKPHLKLATTLEPTDVSIPPDVQKFLAEQDATIIWGGG